MFRRNIIASASIIISTLVLLFSSSPAFAASGSGKTASGDGMRVSPVIANLIIKPGASVTTDVYVQNITNETTELQGIVDDFTASTNESGTPAVLLNGENAPSHSLRQYVQPINDFTLAPNAQKDVKVTINIPKGLAGGGYYGVIRFAPASASQGKNVSLTASVGSLILVTVPGKIVEQMDLASFDARHINTQAGTSSSSASVLFTSNKNIGAVARFENTGNLQEGPFGDVILKKGTKVLATYQLNNVTPRGVVLPSSIRRFVIPLNHLGSFGRYTIEGNFGYGSNGQLLTAQTSFYIVPISLLIVAAVIVLLILFAIFGLPRLLRSYNRSVIRRASRRSR